ncbi:MAG TPA: DUF951 domain-containing protein [Thermomicrobiales bacterium]|jgi:hypothetical protein|nr:DUF951 domain-containing protein [Thermomicrobiales bacterium]
MVLKPPLPIYIDDVVRLRKPHPCGSYDWVVVRVGADIGLRCLTCGRRVLLPRRTVEKRLKQFVSRGPDAPAEASEPEMDNGVTPDRAR